MLVLCVQRCLFFFKCVFTDFYKNHGNPANLMTAAVTKHNGTVFFYTVTGVIKNLDNCISREEQV